MSFTMSCITVVLLVLYCTSAVVDGTESYDAVGGGPAAEYEQYYYHLPENNVHGQIPSPQVYSPSKKVTSPGQVYRGGPIAAAVAAAQHAHQSHYTKPGSLAVAKKVTPLLSQPPLSLPYAYGAVQKSTGIKGKSLAAKKVLPAVDDAYYNTQPAGIPKKRARKISNAETANGYHYAAVPGYGHSGGYPGVGYGNHGTGFGQYGYGGFPYGGYAGGHGLGYGLPLVPPGYALGGITYHGHGGHGHGYGLGYGGGYPTLGGIGHGLGGYGLGYGYLGHGGVGLFGYGGGYHG